MFTLLMTLLGLGLAAVGIVVILGMVLLFVKAIVHVALLPVKLLLFPLKLILLPILAFVVFVKVAVLLTVGVVLLAVLLPILIIGGLIAAPFALLACAVH